MFDHTLVSCVHVRPRVSRFDHTLVSCVHVRPHKCQGSTTSAISQTTASSPQCGTTCGYLGSTGNMIQHLPSAKAKGQGWRLGHCLQAGLNGGVHASIQGQVLWMHGREGVTWFCLHTTSCATQTAPVRKEQTDPSHDLSLLTDWRSTSVKLATC